MKNACINGYNLQDQIKKTPTEVPNVTLVSCDVKKYQEKVFQVFQWLDVINAIDPRIKFTINHTSKTKCDICDDQPKCKIPFLDTPVEIKDHHRPV